MKKLYLEKIARRTWYRGESGQGSGWRAMVHICVLYEGEVRVATKYSMSS